MATTTDQPVFEQEDIDFFRSKLAEKEQEVSALELNMKKAEFKTKRQINEARIAEEFAKSQFKDERAKHAVLEKKIHEAEDAKKATQRKLERALEEKDKAERESQMVKTQYKEFKQEFRKYERILPTQGFLQGHRLIVESILSYQELYYALEQKANSCVKLEDQVARLKELHQEALSDNQKIVAEIRAKNADLERMFKENSEKLQDAENAFTKSHQLAMEQYQQLNHKQQLIDELRSKLQQSHNEITSLQKTNTKLEDKLSLEINTREEEIRELSKTQQQKYYQELKAVERKYQESEKNLLANLENIQDDMSRKLEQINRDKEKVTNQLGEARQEVESIKTKLREQSNLRSALQKDMERVMIMHEAEIQKITKKCESLQQQKETLQKQIQPLKISQQSLKMKLQNLQNRYNSFKQQKQAYIKDLQSHIQDLKIDNEDLQAQKLENQQQIDRLHEQLQQLQTKKQNQGQRSNSLHDIEEAMDTTPKMRKREDSLAGLSVRSRQQTKTRSRANSRIDSKTDSRQKQLEEKLLNSNSKLQSLEQRLSLLTWQTTNERKMAEERQQQLAKVNQQYAFRIDQLIKQDEVSKYLIKKLNEDLLDNKAKIDKSSLSIEEQKKTNGKRISQIERENEIEIKKIKDKMEVLKDENKELMQKIKKEQSAKADASGKVKEAEGKALEKEKQLAQTIKALKQNFQLSSGEISRLQNVISGHFIKQQTANDQIKTLKSQIQDLEKTVSSLKSQISSLQSKISSLEYKITSITQQLTNSNSLLTKSQHQYLSCKTQLATLNENNTSLQKQLQIERKNRTPLIRVPSIQSLADVPMPSDYAELSEKDGEIYILKKQIADLEAQIKRINHSHKQMKDHLSEECEGYIQTIIEMKMKVAETQMRCEEKVHQYNVMKKKLDDANKAKK